MTNTREPSGILVHILPEEVAGPAVFGPYGLVIRESDGAMEMVGIEGVGYNVTDDKPWVWSDYDPSLKKWTPAELLELSKTAETVDLAHWIRQFGARLEQNFRRHLAWADQ